MKVNKDRTSMERAADAEDPNCDMDECTTCGSPIDEEQGDMRGYFGILPMAFCVWCYASLTDMVIQMNGFNDIDVLEERLDELKDELKHEEKYPGKSKHYYNRQDEH